MGWKMIGKPACVLADHALADKFKEMEPCPGDRELNMNRFRFIKSRLVDGEFRFASFASAICLADGKEYRVNGKHTSHAMAELNGELPVMSAIVERYQCDTLQDIADLYATFDTRASSRSTMDTTRAYAQADDVLAAIDDRTVSLCAGGLVVFANANGRNKMSQEQRGRLIVKNSAFVHWFSQLIPKRHTLAHIRRVAAVAAMYATYLVDPDQAQEFWAEVRDDSNTEAQSPSRVLGRWLLTTKARIDDREIFAKSIHAWNAWRRGAKTISMLKWIADAPRPEAI